MNDYLPLLGLLPLILLPALWCGIVFLLSHVSGWQTLARSFPERADPGGIDYRLLSGRVGFVSYRNALRVAAGAEGLHLWVLAFFRLGHKPLLIPWSAMHNRRERSFLWQKTVRVEVGQSGTRIELPADLFGERLPL